MKKAVTIYISVIFMIRRMDDLLKSLGEGTDSAFYEAYKQKMAVRHGINVPRMYGLT